MQTSDKDSIYAATAIAFGTLVEQVRRYDLPVRPVYNLRNLRDKAIAKQFEEACEAVVRYLMAKGGDRPW